MSVQQLEIWLDLEETIINNWDDKLFLQKVTKIKDFIDFHNPEVINIWSFAIWDETDKIHFEASGLKTDIERIFNKPIIKYPSIEDMQKMIMEYENFRYNDIREFVILNGKFWSFIKYGKLQYNKKLILIDDAVPHMEMQLPETKVTIITLNVDKDI